MKRRLLLIAAMFALAVSGALSGEEAAGSEAAADPFAELMKAYPAEVVKTGPTCSIVRIELPPGVTAEEIPGLSAVR